MLLGHNLPIYVSHKAGIMKYVPHGLFFEVGSHYIFAQAGIESQSYYLYLQNSFEYFAF
jgi:hypothetical protein